MIKDILEEAMGLAEFFFGAELTHKAQAKKWVRLPEWTGVWGRKMGKK